MKKIGILTYLREYSNIGTNMQGYSTFKAIQRAYPNDHVELIDYSGWRPAMKPYLSGVSFGSLVYDYKRIRKYRKFFKNDLVFSGEKLISGDTNLSLEFIQKQKYDVIYVGSDTLLELKRAPQDNITAYWLSEKISAKKILIAASSHNVYFEALSDRQKELIGKSIESYSLLGVRDDATSRLLSNFIQPNDNRLSIIPDPTFSYEIEYSHIENYLAKRNIDLNKPIICLHLLRDSKWGYELAKYLKKEGYQIASMRPCSYADILLTDLSPFEHVGIYRYFSLMITHRFHDSIFCFKNHTPVIVFSEFVSDVTKHGESKNKTLFRSFDVEQNFIANKVSINAKGIIGMIQNSMQEFNGKLPYIKAKLEKNRIEYEQFLQHSKSVMGF